ncbi:protein kinase family protein [Streptomyces sp. H10-C2]|uniref:protein kinase family protein n=1 Tax=unclassified Streptomyces TaxID=2593676 RepID=UPI0024B9527E|nr:MULTISPECIES: protein kinase family protein [unclassified Streptomyces]MDJ0340209.1 protein kinase family protein [Streptomyces sp. PH10-H1]MDJ0368342.1 protein kinase family protein [Streptomyces sp. H10-C2]
MADRSTAAVGVANESGEPPLTAQQDGATPDETTDRKNPQDAQEEPQDEAERQHKGKSTPPELHSGHKLARRYQLEECVTRLDGFSSWRAVDEKLRRAVGIHLLPASHSRARQVLAAARSAALLGDPRFVQVLDAVEENDLVYVIHEWLPDAAALSDTLASGPLEPHDAYQMVSQVSQAMAAAHREGLAHLRLGPGSVLRTGSGQYRIRGLAVTAALRGLKSERPQREDTEAIGALLYASLTQRWPYAEDAYGLTGLPKAVGLVAPDQVRAGVHRGLSEIAMRALVNEGATASREESPCTTPEELAKVVAGLPRIRPPEPDISPYQRTTYQQGPYRQAPAAPRPAPAAPPPPPALPGRTGKVLKWAVSALLIAALGLGSWQLADTLMGREAQTEGDSGTSQRAGQDPSHAPSGTPLALSAATEFSPLDSPIAADKAGFAIDGKNDTSWITSNYKGQSNFGNLPNRIQGSGIIVDLGSRRHVTGVDLAMWAPGQTIEVLAAAPDASHPTALADFPQRLSPAFKAGSTAQLSAGKSVETRYVLIHITDLPPESSGGFRGGITEIKVLGAS